MSAFSTISALRRRRPEGLPEGNAAAGGGLQGVACRERLAGGGLPGAPCRERLAGGACRGRLAGGALQGAPCWGRLAGGASQGALADRHPVRGMFPLLALRSDPLRPAPARPVRPPGDFPASPPLRAPLRFGLLLRRRSVPSLRPACTSEMPRRLRTPATTQPHNPATSQPRNHATTQPRSLRNPSATQKGPSPRGESPFASGWRRAPIRGTRAGYRLQRPNRRRRPRWDPWRASAGSCSGPPSAPQSARRGQPSEPPKHRPNQSAG